MEANEAEARASADGGAEAPSAAPASPPRSPRERLTTVFGWLSGGALGLSINYLIFLAVGSSYPTTYTTFAFFLAGAFGGMALGDRLGERGFKPLGIAAGVLLALFVVLVLAVVLSPGATP
jgi:peptidoglycan/LPS O-acetylase OafA/YrhL